MIQIKEGHVVELGTCTCGYAHPAQHEAHDAPDCTYRRHVVPILKGETITVVEARARALWAEGVYDGCPTCPSWDELSEETRERYRIAAIPSIVPPLANTVEIKDARVDFDRQEIVYLGEADKINPAHYAKLNPEPITVIEAWELDFCLGNALKYIARAGRKPGEDTVTELSKAIWYINRRIAQLKDDE